MAAEIRNFVVTIAAGTPIATPQVTALTMPARIVRHVRVRIPPGPLGSVGWALGAAGVPVIPWNAGGWIVGDDETLEWDVSGQIDSGAWQLIGYNLGLNAHSVYVTFSLDLPGADDLPVALVPLNVTAYTSPVDSTTTESEGP